MVEGDYLTLLCPCGAPLKVAGQAKQMRWIIPTQSK